MITKKIKVDIMLQIVCVSIGIVVMAIYIAV